MSKYHLPAADRLHPPLSVDDLWSIDRISSPALSADGTQVVCSVTRASKQTNQSSSSLWLLPTSTASAPRRLTRNGDHDGQPAWSPQGDRIAFIGKREQQGEKDNSPQLYVIAADGGEAERKSRFAPGIESFKWMPDGRRVVFAAWVWPELKGAAAQARQHKLFSERKESGYATSEHFYRHWDHNLPMGRVLHLLLLDLASGRITDLFEGSRWELPRDAGGNDGYDPSPDGEHIAFAHDPVCPPVPGNRLALAEINSATRRVRPLTDEADWEFAAPRYRPDGKAIACTAANIGRRHTAFNQLALVERGSKKNWRLLTDSSWDHHVDSPLRWAGEGSAILFAAESRGRRHLWRHQLSDGSCRIVQPGGWLQGFDNGRDASGEVIVTAADSALHPVRVQLRRGDSEPVRLERFNDSLLSKRSLGEVREVKVAGAQGDPVQVWLSFPPGFDSKKKHPVMQVIHGGPFAAAGDSFSYRWNPHLLAARGHVIAQVNYHGSSGFGFDFRDSIMGRQGELENLDIEAASDWLLAQAWVDRNRLSATGGSYGGFLVAWMNGHVKAGRYRSYVCHAGVFDRVATFSADSYVDRPRDLGASYWNDMAKVLAQSPHSAAAQMKTPTLVIHGGRDYRVPDCNGLAYYNTLKSLGIDARLLWFPDENHWVQKPNNVALWYSEFLDWIVSHDQPAKAKRR